MIRCEALTRYFGGFLAVDDLHFSIERGSVCAFIGPNGAGKTTTMRMLATLLLPSRGRAEIGGKDVVREAQAVRSMIGYLPESFQFYDDLTVERYLQFFARAYNLDSDTTANRITDFLERLGLGAKRHAKVGALSRGMKQRLGVAKSFLHDPEVVFLDEPASGLDPVARTELRDFLRFQQKLGKTVVVSSHVLKELADFCDHILIIHGGRVVEAGPLVGEGGVLARHAEAAQADRRYTIQVLRDGALLEELLGAIPVVRNLKRTHDTATFDFAGDEEAAAGLLMELGQRGLRVIRFNPQEIDLEAVYHKASGGRSES